MEATKAMETMQDANKIIEDFSTEKYALYTVIFLIEVALCFWVGLNI